MACLIDRLRELLPGAVVTGPEELDAVRADKSGHRSEGPPLAVVEARETAQVQALMRFATAEGVAIVPRGAGTGLAGGAIGGPGQIVLSLARMDRILELNPADELAVVEPGVLNGALNAAAAAHGLRFAPDPASKDISSVGGNIATNAGGLLCAKYGVTREAVLGLDVVLADGRLIRTGHRSIKGVAGYDLTALFVGSEGTLGVIVGATVRLTPIPSGQLATVAGVFPDTRAAAAAAAAVTAARLRPAILELIDPLGLQRLRAHLPAEAFAGLGMPQGSAARDGRGPAFLIAQFDDAGALPAAEQAAALFAQAGGSAALGTDHERGERLLAIRRAFHAALEATGSVLIEDVCVPRSALPAMFEAIGRIGQRYGVDIPTVAHAGDGNLHPNFVIPGSAPGAVTGDAIPAFIWEAAGELFSEAVALGGTLTGEHGVGLLKRRWLAQELGEDAYELQRRMRELFDPAGILNPGKVFAG